LLKPADEIDHFTTRERAAGRRAKMRAASEWNEIFSRRDLLSSRDNRQLIRERRDSRRPPNYSNRITY